MPELFNIPEQLSPRLKWMKEHQVIVEKTDHGSPQFVAASGEDWAYGNTKDEAITDLAKKMGWRLWNEEGHE